MALPFPDISPEIFSIRIGDFNLALRWYALAYIAGLIIAWRIVVMLVRRPALWRGGHPPLSPEQSEDLLTWIILGVVFGGRLGYVLFYKPLYYLQNLLEIPQVWQGGMSFHGGLIGVILAIYFYSRKHDLPKWSVGDAVSTGAPWGLFLGRVANFINAELWGRPTDAPFGVVFPGEAAQSCGQALGELCARHPSQLYEAVLEGLILGVALLYLALRRDWLKYPGAIFGLLVAGYGSARFLVEFVRQPDAHFVTLGNPLGLAWEIGGYGLTMGQILSLPMIAAGLFLIARSRRI